ncbi:MAG: metal ABC transporter permease [Caldilineaceae bacterium]|nr:metal ABC transporter permease [Caldilineaceae bacterium]
MTAILTAVVGLYASYHLNVASGPAMALVAMAIFAVAYAVAVARR